MVKTVIAFDLEAFYDKSLNIKNLGASNYLRGTDVYLVSFWGPDGGRVCHPSEVDWSQFRDCELWSHNRMFDGQYFTVDGISDPGGNCTANLSRYLCGESSLVDAARALLGETVSKKVREELKGVRFQDLSPAQQQEVRVYALRDAELCYRLTLLRDRWPAWEQRLSFSTIKMGARGVRIDLEYLLWCKQRARDIIDAASLHVPWVGQLNEKDKPIATTSRKEMLAHLAKIGVPAPTSFDASKAEFRRWLEEYGDQHVFVAAIRDIRRANQKLKKLEAMERRIGPGGRMSYDLLYMGAPHTGRWSGAAGDERGERESVVNMQNLDKSSYEGISLRRLIVPDPGNILVACDLAAIEPRVLAWCAGDEKILTALKAGYNVYEAQARTWGFWNGKAQTLKRSEPALYKKMKQFSLGCGYAMGPKRLKQNIEDKLDSVVTEAEAKELIATYRRHNPKVLEFWKWCQRRLDETFLDHKDRTLILDLPSGRTIRYEDIYNVDDEKAWGLNLYGRVGGKERKLYGGSVCENVVQACARDIFAAAFLRIEEAGFLPIMCTHDEAVVEAPIGTEDKEVEVIMAAENEWFPDLALGAEAEPMTAYGKREMPSEEEDRLKFYKEHQPQ